MIGASEPPPVRVSTVERGGGVVTSSHMLADPRTLRLVRTRRLASGIRRSAASSEDAKSLIEMAQFSGSPDDVRQTDRRSAKIAKVTI
jgi:hypothetical protein